MAKPIPAEKPKRYTHWLPPSLMNKFKEQAGHYKSTRAMIEAIKMWLAEKEKIKPIGK